MEAERAGTASATSRPAESATRDDRAAGARGRRRAGQKRESVAVGAQVRQEGDAAAVDARAEQLEQPPGRTVTEPATAQAMTAIVPLAIPLKMSEPIDVLAGHRDRDGGAGDQHGAAGGARGALERLVRRRGRGGAPRASG